MWLPCAFVWFIGLHFFSTSRAYSPHKPFSRVPFYSFTLLTAQVTTLSYASQLGMVRLHELSSEHDPAPYSHKSTLNEIACITISILVLCFIVNWACESAHDGFSQFVLIQRSSICFDWSSVGMIVGLMKTPVRCCALSEFVNVQLCMCLHNIYTYATCDCPIDSRYVRSTVVTVQILTNIRQILMNLCLFSKGHVQTFFENCFWEAVSGAWGYQNI